MGNVGGGDTLQGFELDALKNISQVIVILFFTLLHILYIMKFFYRNYRKVIKKMTKIKEMKKVKMIKVKTAHALIVAKERFTDIYSLIRHIETIFIY
jgi:hypothetical protein